MGNGAILGSYLTRVLLVDPQSKALQYCQCIFEGMKATMGADGIPKLLRPDLNIERFNLSAARMCMPAVPADIFLQALKNLISLDVNWVPKAEGSALYCAPYHDRHRKFIGCYSF